MIGYVTLGSNDLERTKAFYDGLVPTLGGKQVMDMGRIVFYGNGRGRPMLAVCTPYDEQTATTGNGTMVALDAGSREKVDEVYNKAIELGAADEGAPGERVPGFYGGYFRDPDGNKLVAYVMG